jgi:hypothetical protein
MDRLSTPQDDRQLMLECAGGSTVVEVNSGIKSKSPVPYRATRLEHERAYFCDDCAVPPFCHSVLGGRMGDRSFVSCALLVEMCFEFVRRVLTAPITAHSTNLTVVEGGGMSLEF